MRVAAYCRYSSDLQRSTSIEDQLRVARDYAERHGWAVLDAHIYADAAISGASIEARPGMQALLRAIESSPPPFDVLLVDDSSRVSRDLADAVRFLQRIKFHGVRAIYISQGIDSASEQAETLVAVHGMVDSLYLREMRSKIKRGLVGQLTRGYHTGARIWGYRTVPELDPTGRTDSDGRPAIIGKRIELAPDEARAIVQIFEWYADGIGVPTIVRRLNQAKVPTPRKRGMWTQSPIRRLLHNERYRGLQIYGQETVEREPGTKRRVMRPVPREKWQIVERPDLRIVSEDLWTRVQERRAIVRTEWGIYVGGRTLVKGRNASLYSTHLFGGLMTCSVCGAAVGIVSGGNGSPRYGCRKARHIGPEACSNALTIKASVADAALLKGLQDELQRPETLRYVTGQLAAALNRVLDERPTLLVDLESRRDATARKLANLTRAVEEGGAMPTLLQAMARHEADLHLLEAELADLEDPIEDRMAVMPGWVRQQLIDLAGLLSDSPARAKTEFRRLGLHFALEPAGEPAKPFLRAIGTGSLEHLGIRSVMPSAHSGQTPPR
jgi:site-specific DNA recombinase